MNPSDKISTNLGFDSPPDIMREPQDRRPYFSAACGQNALEKTLEEITSQQVVIPARVKNKLFQGATIWDTVVSYHREMNPHHNYATSDPATCQEIALDFFSSALVSCPLQSTSITRERFQTAFNTIQKWPNYVMGSPEIKSAVKFVFDNLFLHYDSKPDQGNEIPLKPYDVTNAQSRCASEILMAQWRRYVNPTETRPSMKESILLIDLLKILVLEDDVKKATKMWRQIFPVLFLSTEMKKWVMEVFHHKGLIIEFHRLLQSTKGYLVSDDVALNHDDDKYLSFQLIGYVLKWYYGNESQLFPQ